MTYLAGNFARRFSECCDLMRSVVPHACHTPSWTPEIEAGHCALLEERQLETQEKYCHRWWFRNPAFFSWDV